MANKSGMDRLADLAHHAKALKDIIKAALRGGWHAVALQALKHYWPQILAIALVLLFLPLLIFLCLPAMLFGFGSSGGGATASMSFQATTVKGYYGRYAEYCTARIDEIKKTVIDGSTGGGDDTVHEPPDQEYAYEIVLTGEPMEENWFIALHSVTTGNDLNAMSEQSVKEFVEKSIVYTVEDKPAGKETTTTGTAATTTTTAFHDDTVNNPPTPESNAASESSTTSATEPPAATKILKIRYLSPPEFLDYYRYSDADRNWAQLMVQTLEQGTSSAG